ncbi:MAG TPA: DUF2892 domain-containing protein [Stellaceae bacterium]|nr:DUF2892 domain-containing protein [Stellaceae bacterium]
MAAAANVGSAERIGSVIAGAALIAQAIGRPSLLRIIVAIGGWALLQRGLTGRCALYERLDAGRADAPRDPVREASEDSFPASDPPAWTPVTGALADR